MKKNLKNLYNGLEKANPIVGFRELDGAFIIRGNVKNGNLVSFNELYPIERELILENAIRQSFNPRLDTK